MISTRTNKLFIVVAVVVVALALVSSQYGIVVEARLQGGHRIPGAVRATSRSSRATHSHENVRNKTKKTTSQLLRGRKTDEAMLNRKKVDFAARDQYWIDEAKKAKRAHQTA